MTLAEVRCAASSLLRSNFASSARPALAAATRPARYSLVTGVSCRSSASCSPAGRYCCRVDNVGLARTQSVEKFSAQASKAGSATGAAALAAAKSDGRAVARSTSRQGSFMGDEVKPRNTLNAQKASREIRTEDSVRSVYSVV